MSIKNYQNIDSLGGRVRFFRRHKELTITSFAKSIGLKATAQGRISDVETGKVMPGTDLIIDISINYPDLNTTWLLTGEGSMKSESDNVSRAEGVREDAAIYNNTPEYAKELLMIMRDLTDEQRDWLLMEAREKRALNALLKAQKKRND